MTLHRSLPLVIALTCVLAFWGLPAHADTTIHVAPTGSDAAAGTETAPLRTLGAALAKARNGEHILLEPGTYPSARDELRRTQPVTITGAGVGTTVVAGLDIFGGQRLTFSDITFSGGIRVQGHPTRHASQPATAIAIRDSQLSSPGTCLTIKEGSQDILLTSSRLQSCYTGIAGPGSPYPSRQIQIDGNVIEQSRSDAIQFGSWHDVQISDNVIRTIRDPANVIHNDGIQLTGDSTGVRIERNTITDSRTQLVFIQDAIGPIDDIQLVNNLLVGAGAVALQVQGATQARIASNTIWNGKDGGLWLRKGYQRDGTAVVPTDTVVTNNLASTYRTLDGAAAATSLGNVVLCRQAPWEPAPPAGTACVNDPKFADTRSADYRLRPDSPARPLATTVGLPEVDLTGAVRDEPAPGAYR